MHFNLLLFTVAPKPTTPDVIMMSIKDAPTTPLLVSDTGADQSPDLLRPVNTEPPAISDTGAMTTGDEPENSNRNIFGELTVTNVTSKSIKLAWSAPDEAFDSFLVELNAPTTQTRMTTLPGSVRKAEIEGLSPSTRYDITLHGLVQGERSLPLKVFATTGTWSRDFIS